MPLKRGQISHKYSQKTPIAHPNARYGCLLWIQHLFDIQPQVLLSFMQYITKLDRVITAFDCILPYISHPHNNSATLVKEMAWRQTDDKPLIGSLLPCLYLSIRNSLACARASKLTTTKMYMHHSVSLGLFHHDFNFPVEYDIYISSITICLIIGAPFDWQARCFLCVLRKLARLSKKCVAQGDLFVTIVVSFLLIWYSLLG